MLSILRISIYTFKYEIDIKLCVNNEENVKNTFGKYLMIGDDFRLSSKKK